MLPLFLTFLLQVKTYKIIPCIYSPINLHLTMLACTVITCISPTLHFLCFQPSVAAPALHCLSSFPFILPGKTLTVRLNFDSPSCTYWCILHSLNPLQCIHLHPASIAAPVYLQRLPLPCTVLFNFPPVQVVHLLPSIPFTLSCL